MTALLHTRPTLRTAQPVVSFDEARTLAEIHGSPLLTISRGKVAENYRALKNALPGVEMYYAAKANPDPIILRTLADLGSSVDVCSVREMQAALDAGFHPSDMIHTHPCKTVRNLTDCYAMGMRWFVYDNALELQKMADYAPDANLILRLAMASQSSLIDLSAKFGAAPSEALGLLRTAKRMGLRPRALSFHVGSQCTNTDDYVAAFRTARRVYDEAAEAGIELEMIDIGGGVPAPYREAILSLDDFAAAVGHALSESFADTPVRLIAEPGRGICAEAGTLITQVIGKSVRGGKDWYFLDDGLYGSFSGKVFDHVDYPLLAENMDSRDLYPCVVAGPTCDSTDIVSRDQYLPKLEVGELLIVPSMGAYTSASASYFNGLDPAKSIAVD